MAEEADISAIHRGRREVLMGDGRIVRWTSMHSADGVEVEDLVDAAYILAEMPDGRWLQVQLAAFPPSPLN